MFSHNMFTLMGGMAKSIKMVWLKKNWKKLKHKTHFKNTMQIRSCVACVAQKKNYMH